MRYFSAIVLAIMVLTAPIAAHAAGESESKDVTASARIIKPVSLDKEADLDFGTIISNNQPGSVTVDAGGGGQQDQGGASTFEAGDRAAFSVSGEADSSFQVDHPSQVVLASGSDQLTASLENDLAASQGILDALGEAGFHIGGTLDVPANAASGNYVGTFQVTVSYL